MIFKDVPKIAASPQTEGKLSLDIEDRNTIKNCSACLS